MKLFLTIAFAFSFFTLSFGQLNTTLLSNVDYAEGVNDCWGYVAPDGTEYALVGVQNGVSIVSLADPSNAQELFFINGVRSTWRDMKTFGEYAYVTNESGDGVMVIDMSELPDNVSFTNYVVPMPNGMDQISRCHNLFIDSVGHIYLTGCNVNSGGIVILDATANATEPPVIALGPAIYSHDIFVLGNYMYASEIYAGELGIYDISDLNNIKEVSHRLTPFRFTHNAWTTKDGNYVFTTDERANAYVAAYDITDKSDIVFLDEHRPLATEGNGVIPHNVHVTEDNFLVTSHYTDGVIIVDANRPSNLIEVGNYDTFNGPDGGFSGCWGAYPFLPSGVILASDRQTGLYVLGAEYIRTCYLEGKVTDYITGQPVFMTNVEILDGDLNQSSTDLNGDYATGQVTSGEFEVRYTASGYIPQIITVTLENGMVTVQDVQLIPTSGLVDKSGKIFMKYDSTPIKGAHVLRYNEDFNFSAFSDASGSYSMDQIVWSDYAGVAGSWSFKEMVLDTVTVNSNDDWPDIYLEKGHEDGFMLDQGWSVSGSASQGAWVRTRPTAQFIDSVQTSPGEDVDLDFGDLCFVTGNGAATAEEDGVKGGFTRLISPPIDLSLYNAASISWMQWLYSKDIPNALFYNVGAIQDSMDIFIFSSSQFAPGWEEMTLDAVLLERIQGLDLDRNFQIYFEVVNEDTTGIVEVGVDMFRIEDTEFERSFSLDSTVTCAGSTLQFHDNNKHTISWEWVFFSDTLDIRSNEKDPEILFEEVGVYDVSLTAVSCFGDTLQFTKPLLVEVLDAPVADFSFLPPSPTENEVQFFNESAFGWQYRWDFGDGVTSDQRDPFHEYENDGEYEVVLIVDNVCGSDTIIRELEVITPPVAGFTVSDSLICPGDTIFFMDMSSSNVSAWSWEFEGGLPAMSSDTNPVVSYADPGLYGVRLIVTGAGGSDTLYRPIVIEVGELPVANFDFMVDGRKVVFTDRSTGADKHLWAFGDGSISIDSDPVYEYSEDGIYVVNLFIENDCGSANRMDTIVIRGTGLHKFIEGTVVAGPNPFTDHFDVRFTSRTPVILELYGITGKKLASRKFDSGPVNYTVDELTHSGIFVLVLRDESGAVIFTKRMVRD